MSWFDQLRLSPVTTRGRMAPTSPSSADPWDAQLEAALRGSYGGAPVNEDFIRNQIEYYNQRRHSGELTGAGMPADDAYWLSRAAQAARDDPASGLPGAGGGIAASQLPPGYSMVGANRLSSFGAPGLAAPWTQEFQAPTGTDDPGFQFALNKGLEAVQKSAAAKGTLLTGGTLKDLTDYATGMSLQGYGDAWNRAFQTYGMDRDTFWGNQNNAFNRLSGLSGQGQQAASSYGTNLGNLYTSGANANANTTMAQNNNLNSLFGGLAEIGTAIARDRWGKKKPQQPGTNAGTIWEAP